MKNSEGNESVAKAEVVEPRDQLAAEFEGYPGIAHDFEQMRQQRDELVEQVKTLSTYADEATKRLKEATNVLRDVIGQIDPKNTNVGLGNYLKARELLAKL